MASKKSKVARAPDPPSSLDDPRRLIAQDARRALADSRWTEAEALCRKGLGIGIDAELELILGEAVTKLGRPGEAAICFARALGLASRGSSIWIEAAREHVRFHLTRGENKEAIDLLREIVAVHPDDVRARRLFAIALRREGRLKDVEEQYRAILSYVPDQLDAAIDLAWFLEETGQKNEALNEALATCKKIGLEERAIRLRAVIERRQGRHGLLIEWLKEQLRISPDHITLWRELAHTVAALDGSKTADLYREVLKRAPNDFEAMMDLANRLNRTRGPHEGAHIEEAYQLVLQAMQVVPKPTSKTKEIHEILNRAADYARLPLLGTFQDLCQEWGRGGQAAALHGMMGQVLTPEDRILLLESHRQCGQQMDRFAKNSPLPPSPSIGKRARIRIGFMSSDLRNHPVAYFVWPLLQNLDRKKFEIYCYSWSTAAIDHVQKMIADHVDCFRHEPIIGNRDAAALIANDQLDMLFELGGSTHMNKLDVMSWRPAPRQASWLGYPNSAGLETIDRLLVDPYLRPAFRNLMIEEPFELAHSWVCFEAPGFGKIPEISTKSPQERNGFVTFGTMNNPYKYNPILMRSWAEIMRAVPHSRLLFVRPEGATPSFRRNLSQFFEREGVDAKRLMFIPVRGQHMPHYNEIDISLDTFPQTGGTTTCETLFMGVPVVTLVGTAFYERISYSNLMNAGLAELVAYSRETYVKIAIRLAHDVSWRNQFRKTARQRITSHPLGQPQLFAKDFAQAANAWMDDAI